MTTPVFLSPALPSDLLLYVLRRHVYPTTLVICSSQADFLTAASEDISRKWHRSTPTDRDHQELGEGESSQHQDSIEEEAEGKHALLSSPLYQIAASRHIHVVYVPTVTHLRAYLSAFSPDESRVPAPPFTSEGDGEPHIILYGLLNLHRDTSEWSAQGLINTTSALVGLAHRLSWRAFVIEPLSDLEDIALEEMLQETLPILKGGARRLGPKFEEGAWSGRTVEIGRALGRWFRFQRAQWSNIGCNDQVFIKQSDQLESHISISQAGE
ncbi:hypothetical protein F5B22DRAFT_407585 [Xylaria bambusicola]|uniref:uncharacterized protein n=1 Tax=Xylaria bambusicola TaxID=326684 RepID=UPI0020089F9D|nr:uncharacterized protein F5B22DRAFT_407585 [Xylaria bambusicola]KAI0523648.1 hypothetical protein F5B22DRAFT_407585 [Xylaria bambusicola]